MSAAAVGSAAKGPTCVTGAVPPTVKPTVGRPAQPAAGFCGWQPTRGAVCAARGSVSIAGMCSASKPVCVVGHVDVATSPPKPNGCVLVVDVPGSSERRLAAVVSARVGRRLRYRPDPVLCVESWPADKATACAIAAGRGIPTGPGTRPTTWRCLFKTRPGGWVISLSSPPNASRCIGHA